eukprot:CAMPEP_0202906624 /NCGR_PEP_ID=MMETSP1392-20130828/39817_1 /ASSEMBLY_ACC=CAM_ASM_000868 /TAXON_ID=225041 /ORGANISM="Chlamydomonas chlamydogama, Strain SAG 11-48b" /LENGTH=44 /DNA_ID= /DNA_START= /DNA_END= /DNA_ORIENTATION=
MNIKKHEHAGLHVIEGSNAVPSKVLRMYKSAKRTNAGTDTSSNQ